jgi:hypothetical protein
MLLLREGFARKPNILPTRADIVVRELKEKMDSLVMPGTMLVEVLLCRTDEDRLGIVAFECNGLSTAILEGDLLRGAVREGDRDGGVCG